MYLGGHSSGRHPAVPSGNTSTISRPTPDLGPRHQRQALPTADCLMTRQLWKKAQKRYIIPNDISIIISPRQIYVSYLLRFPPTASSATQTTHRQPHETPNLSHASPPRQPASQPAYRTTARIETNKRSQSPSNIIHTANPSRHWSPSTPAAPPPSFGSCPLPPPIPSATIPCAIFGGIREGCRLSLPAYSNRDNLAVWIFLICIFYSLFR